MALTKQFTETYTPAIAYVPYRPYSRQCPQPPPVPKPPPTQGPPTPPPQPAPPSLSFHAQPGADVACFLYWVGSDGSTGYGDPGLYITLCIPVSAAIVGNRPPLPPGAALIRQVAQQDGADCIYEMNGCIYGQFFGDPNYIEGQGCSPSLPVCPP